MGTKGPPIWVPDGIKINAASYQDILKSQVRPWIDAHFAPGTWLWQQDGATAHTASSTQKMLREEGWCFWDNSMWPPSSLDWAVLDYAIWDYIAGLAGKESAPIVSVMKERVEAAWEGMSADFIKKVTGRFRSSLEAVVAKEGGRIE